MGQAILGASETRSKRYYGASDTMGKRDYGASETLGQAILGQARLSGMRYYGQAILLGMRDLAEPVVLLYARRRQHFALEQLFLEVLQVLDVPCLRVATPVGGIGG